MGPATPAVSAPELVGGRRFRAVRRAALLLALLALLPVLAVGVALLRLPRTDVPGLAAAGTPLHVLVTGSDSREDLDDAERQELSTGSASGERTDTILILSVDGGRAGLLSIPRDLLVERCDGSVGRINAAIGIDGPGCLVTTVRAVTGLDVAHHVTVTFGGFRDVVDAVGGVEVCLERAISDRDAGIDLPEGCQRLDGATALGYVRVRKVDSDLFRIQRQQRFIAALAAELVAPARLARPWELPGLATGLAGALTVDRGLGPVAAARLVPAARALASGRAVTATLPTRGATTSSGASVQVLVEDEAAALLAAWLDGSALVPPAVPDGEDVPAGDAGGDPAGSPPG